MLCVLKKYIPESFETKEEFVQVVVSGAFIRTYSKIVWHFFFSYFLEKRD